MPSRLPAGDLPQMSPTLLRSDIQPPRGTVLRCLWGVGGVACVDKKGDVAAIYEPPKPSLPYLVVTIDKDGVAAVPVPTRKEARGLIAKEVRRREKRERKRDRP